MDRRLTAAAWTAFLCIWGVSFLIERLLQLDLRGLQYLSGGVILLALNAVRYTRGIPMTRLTLMLGLLALPVGILRQATGEVSIPLIVLLTIGSVILVEWALGRQASRVPLRPRPERRRG